LRGVNRLRLTLTLTALVILLSTAVQALADPPATTPPGTANSDYAESEPPLELGEIDVVTRDVRAGRPITIRVQVSAPATLTVRVSRAQGEGWRRPDSVLVVRRPAGSNTLRLPADAMPKAGRYRISVDAETDSGQTAKTSRRIVARG
jgi:hypothetical protein